MVEPGPWGEGRPLVAARLVGRPVAASALTTLGSVAWDERPVAAARVARLQVAASLGRTIKTVAIGTIGLAAGAASVETHWFL